MKAALTYSAHSATPPIYSVSKPPQPLSEDEAAIKIQAIGRRFAAKAQIAQVRRELASHLWTHLQHNKNPIDDGYGEYVVYSKTDQPIDQETYEPSYRILAEARSTRPSASIIRAKIQAINPNLDIVFIPQTLYELIYIEAAIREEIDAKQFCMMQHLNNQKQSLPDHSPDEDKCWHLCHFYNEIKINNENRLLKILSFRMNALVCQKIIPISPLTGERIADLTKDGIKFLQDHGENFAERLSSMKWAKDSSTLPTGPFVDLARAGLLREEDHNGHLIPKNPHLVTTKPIKDIDIQFICNALALECHSIAKNVFILYRASNAFTSLPENMNGISISYGTSLFAGVFQDPSACVFSLEFKSYRTVHAIIISAMKPQDIFYIPTDSSIGSMLAEGETFHARSKVPQESSTTVRVEGFELDTPPGNPLRDRLNSSCDQKTLRALLTTHHQQAFCLRP